jgi:hypothetical protein
MENRTESHAMTHALSGALRHITTGTITTMLLKGWIVSEVEKWARLPGLYPMTEETKARYEAWKKKA